MKPINEIKKNNLLKIKELGEDGGWGNLLLPGSRRIARVVFSWGCGWDHVSVSYSNRCPTWDEMCMVKDIFFRSDECVVQYHPAKEDYVNIYPYCLHLWKPQGQEVPKPPAWMVG